MELIGSLFLILALALIVALFVARPFISGKSVQTVEAQTLEQEHDHLRSSLLAERDRILNALQELDFDFSLGKVPEEDYPFQRSALLKSGSDVLRRLDQLQTDAERIQPLDLPGSAEERIEAAVASRRADASSDAAAAQRPASAAVVMAAPNGEKDALEDLIASRKRQRQEKAAGFCPKCGRPVQKSDKFCSRCGTTL